MNAQRDSLPAVPFFYGLSAGGFLIVERKNVSMGRNIRDEIVEKRRERVARLGHAEGADLPQRREVPIVRFLDGDGLICEIKRRSPSKGAIAPGLDAVEQAGRYVAAGARNLSVLTEPEGFGGSLDDLMRVKKAFPHVAVLRKDFLFDAHDIDAAWRAGADAVLLIAGMLSADRLNLLYRCAKSLGLEALVEIHDDEDLAKAASIQPDLVGVNSRDLVSFKIDPLIPVKVKAKIDWKTRVVYESGITHPDHAAFAASCGFYGLLVGESVVRDSGMVDAIHGALRNTPEHSFWPRLCRALNDANGKPAVKICGLAREDDARLAADLGAAALGFVFWPKSPRRAAPALLHAVRDIDVPKIAVVVNEPGAPALDAEVRDLLSDGLVDAVQYHGGETADDCPRLWPGPHYKALRPASPEALAEADPFRCPRVLLDAAAAVPGGSGKRVGVEVLDAWHKPLWLAGGVTPENVGRIAAARHPELLDVASGVEQEPGKKESNKLHKLFKELYNA